jgi:hypothetical protein
MDLSQRSLSAQVRFGRGIVLTEQDFLWSEGDRVGSVLVQVSAAEAGTEGHTLAVLDATQPLIRQVEQMAHQLAQAEESHGNALAALQDELADARIAARAKEEEVCELRDAQEAAQREGSDACRQVSQLRHVIGTRDAEIVGLKGACKRWEERVGELELLLREAEAARLSEVEVRVRWVLHDVQGGSGEMFRGDSGDIIRGDSGDIIRGDSSGPVGLADTQGTYLRLKISRVCSPMEIDCKRVNTRGAEAAGASEIKMQASSRLVGCAFVELLKNPCTRISHTRRR